MTAVANLGGSLSKCKNMCVKLSKILGYECLTIRYIISIKNKT